MCGQGGLVAKLRYGNTTLCFISCHLAAHQHKLDARNKHVREVLKCAPRSRRHLSRTPASRYIAEINRRDLYLAGRRSVTSALLYSTPYPSSTTRSGSVISTTESTSPYRRERRSRRPRSYRSVLIVVVAVVIIIMCTPARAHYLRMPFTLQKVEAAAPVESEHFMQRRLSRASASTFSLAAVERKPSTRPNVAAKTSSDVIMEREALERSAVADPHAISLDLRDMSSGGEGEWSSSTRTMSSTSLFSPSQKSQAALS